jgi:hypothetical protein
LRNASELWRARGREILEKVKKGKGFSAAMAETGLMGALGGAKEDQNQQYMGQQGDELLVKAMESKINKRNFEANVRIVVSIKDEFRSEQVFDQLAGALDQFCAPGLNEFRATKKKGKAGAPILNDYIFRNFNSAHKSILSVE